jgi:hypothetical protein
MMQKNLTIHSAEGPWTDAKIATFGGGSRTSVRRRGVAALCVPPGELQFLQQSKGLRRVWPEDQLIWLDRAGETVEERGNG